MIDCPHCDGLQKAALRASRAYHKLVGDLEAAHIIHDSEATGFLSIHLEKALRDRNAAIAELTAHENAHAQTKPVMAGQQLSKRQRLDTRSAL